MVSGDAAKQVKLSLIHVERNMDDKPGTRTIADFTLAGTNSKRLFKCSVPLFNIASGVNLKVRQASISASFSEEIAARTKSGEVELDEHTDTDGTIPSTGR